MNHPTGLTQLGGVLSVTERTGQLRARERRGLHRLGFRGTLLSRCTVWRWEPTAEALVGALHRPVTPFERDLVPGGSLMHSFHPQIRTAVVRHCLLRDRAVQVLRDVLRGHPTHIVIGLAPEPDDGLGSDDDRPSSDTP